MFYCEDLNQEVVRFKQVEQEIREGLVRREFVPYYQPQIDSRSGRIVGVECLARWLHRDKGVISPVDFITVAEKSGLIQEMFMQVLSSAIGDISDWKNVMAEIFRFRSIFPAASSAINTILNRCRPCCGTQGSVRIN